MMLITTTEESTNLGLPTYTFQKLRAGRQAGKYAVRATIRHRRAIQPQRLLLLSSASQSVSRSVPPECNALVKCIYLNKEKRGEYTSTSPSRRMGVCVCLLSRALRGDVCGRRHGGRSLLIAVLLLLLVFISLTNKYPPRSIRSLYLYPSSFVCTLVMRLTPTGSRPRSPRERLGRELALHRIRTPKQAGRQATTTTADSILVVLCCCCG